MKKKIVKVLACSLTFCMVLTAAPAYAGLFGSKKATAATTTTDTDYTFIYNNTTIQLKKEADPVIKALGAYTDKNEQDSCAYQGKEIVYFYPGFEVTSSLIDGKNCISSVYFTDKTAATPEGIKIGSSYNDMVKAYGTGYKEEAGGAYRYTRGNTQLSIYCTNKVVDSVEYLLVK